MQRVLSLTLLVILMGGISQAQSGMVMSRGFARPSGHIGGGITSPQRGLLSRHSHFRQFQAGASAVVPLWYGDPFAYDYAYANVDPAMNAPTPLIMMQPEVPQPPAATTIPITPKLIEVPGASGDVTPKPPRPAVFVLMTGERLESPRYLLTAQKLYITLNRHERTIPLSVLDLQATVGANRERGIELRIPTDPNEITLAF